MDNLAKKHTDRLKELKKTVDDSRIYFNENIKRFNKFMSFVFKSSLTNNEVSTLGDIGMPTIEFNILEAYISRLRGEFAKQQPSLTVRAADGVPSPVLDQSFIDTIEIIEAHLKAAFFDGTNDMLEYDIYTDLLAGGFSVMEVYTEYVNEMSFEQNICVERAFEPTMCGFDPLARQSHKGDGRFCYKLYPMTEKMFIDEFGKEAAEKIKFTKGISGFDWSFTNGEEKIVLVCDFYEKKTSRETLIKLSNGHSCTEKQYKKFLKEWETRGGFEQPPIPVGKSRKTVIETICRYRFCESKVLDYIETDFKYFPLIFVDGNSVMIKEGGSYTQMTRPYVYHAEGIQKLKNFAGQSLANELENTIQHKFVVAIESIPTDYLSAYENVQKADTLVYNHFLDSNNPNVTLPPPREIVRTPIPPQIAETFRLSDEMTQAILGSYDGAAGQNNGQLSGIAFARSAIQSNNASVPYVVGFIKGLNRVAQLYVDLIPKYYRTPRSLPVLLPNGKREYIEINKKGTLYMNFDPNSLQVKIETGVNFAMQKEIALQTIISLSQASPVFAEFFNQYGLNSLLDNIDIRGIDELKLKAEDYQEKLQKQSEQQQQMQSQQMQVQSQQQQMAMQQAQKQLQSPTREQVELIKLQETSKKDSALVAVQEQNAETKFLEVMNSISNADVQNELKAAQVHAEETRSVVDMAISVSSHHNDLKLSKKESDSAKSDGKKKK